MISRILRLFYKLIIFALFKSATKQASMVSVRVRMDMIPTVPFRAYNVGEAETI